jgi:hypothetical protein
MEGPFLILRDALIVREISECGKRDIQKSLARRGYNRAKDTGMI